jgi:hypothetical protein
MEFLYLSLCSASDHYLWHSAGSFGLFMTLNILALIPAAVVCLVSFKTVPASETDSREEIGEEGCNNWPNILAEICDHEGLDEPAYADSQENGTRISLDKHGLRDEKLDVAALL